MLAHDLTARHDPLLVVARVLVHEHRAPDQLVGRHIIIVANLAPRVLRGEESRGMLLAASNVPKDAATADPTVVRRVVLLRPDVEIEPGSIVS